MSLCWLVLCILLIFVHHQASAKGRSHINRVETSLFREMLALCGLEGLFATQYQTAQDIPDSFFKEKRVIRAHVVKVTDGDTYRVRHIASSSSRAFDGPLKDNTISVRIAAVDTPETAKFGNAGQPFAKEAKEFAENKLLSKDVKVKLLSRDQYGRVIALVKYREQGVFSWFRGDKDISEELLRHGLASVYRQGGAQYDGSVQRWDAIESHAKRKKKGMWCNGVENAELPSDYKKKNKKGSKKTEDKSDKTK